MSSDEIIDAMERTIVTLREENKRLKTERSEIRDQRLGFITCGDARWLLSAAVAIVCALAVLELITQ